MTGEKAAPEVVFFGEFGCGNLGNEASLSAALKWLEGAPQLVARCITREPVRVTQAHGIPAVAMYASRAWGRRLPRIVAKPFAKLFDQVRITRLVNSRSVVVVPGMGVFEEDLSGPPWGLPLALFGLAVAVRVRRARLALVAVGASPDTRRVVRWMNRFVFNAADFVTFRDSFSREAMAGQGVDVSGAVVVPDIAFSLDEQRVPSKESGTSKVGVGILSYYDVADPRRGEAVAQAYEATMAEFCQHLVAEGRIVEVLVGDASDEPVAQRLLSTLAAIDPTISDSVSFRAVTDHRELARTVAAQDLVVGTRYHNLVFALRAGRPTMSIGYAPKCHVLLDDAGLGDYALEMVDLDLADLGKRFARLVSDYEDARRGAEGFAESSLRRSQEHADRFLGWLQEGTGSR